jgi:Ni,Fe-hydrogenase III small subunit/formate hydrogenlyase subunit 6/NADH:ubiquinone oxidoreductase subunit I
MFKILQKTFSEGIATVPYPDAAPVISEHFRGCPEFDFAAWWDARQAAEACPTGAIAIADVEQHRHVTVDYGRCTFCGQCEGDGVRMTGRFELAARSRESLLLRAEYRLAADGTHRQLIAASAGGAGEGARQAIHKVLGRALAIRQVDAGSCNGCELEIGALNNPVHDLERLGAHFVASPRHADMLLVTGPVTRNMELALAKTYAATPDPKVVVAVGACGISGGIFGVNYASRGGVDAVVPVDVYIPGCPPRPEALIHGILLAVGRLDEKLAR